MSAVVVITIGTSGGRSSLGFRRVLEFWRGFASVTYHCSILSLSECIFAFAPESYI